MIFDKVFMSLGIVRKSVYDELKYKTDKYERLLLNEEAKNRAYRRDNDKLKRENTGLELKAFELSEQLNKYKQKYADEVQKRLEIVEILAESEIIIKEPKSEDGKEVSDNLLSVTE